MLDGRRGLGAAVLLCLVGAFVVLVGVGRVWTSVQVPAGPLSGSQDVSLTGDQLVAGLRALGLVGLAGVVALVATRRVGRLVVGGLLVLTGSGVVVAALGADWGDRAVREAAAVTTGPTPVDVLVQVSLWPEVTALGGGLLALAGLLGLLRGRSWPGLGQRYDAPAAAGSTQPAPERSERGLWEALDRGEDPTGGGATPGSPVDPGSR